MVAFLYKACTEKQLTVDLVTIKSVWYANEDAGLLHNADII